MAFLNQQIFNVNIDQNIISTPAGVGASTDQVPIVTLTQKNIVFVIDLLLDAGLRADFLIEATDTFAFAADVDFNPATANMMVSTNAEFNITGDRSDLDVTGGKISVRVDADTLPLENGLGIQPEIQLFGEIKIFAAAAINPKVIFTFPILARNTVDNSTSPLPPISNFYTKAEVDALLAAFAEQDTFATASPVDVTGLATHSLFTVPAGKIFIPEVLYDITDTISGGGVAHQYKLKTDLPRDLSSVLVSDSDTVDEFKRVDIADTTAVRAGRVVQVEVTTASTFTTHNVIFAVGGRMIDA